MKENEGYGSMGIVVSDTKYSSAGGVGEMGVSDECWPQSDQVDWRWLC